MADILTAAMAALVLTGPDSWAGRESRLARVNPPVRIEDGSVLSLRGEWEFAAFRHALEARDLGYSNDKDFWGKDSVWKNSRKIQVPGCWEAQGVGEPGPGYSYNARPSEDFRLRHSHLGNGFYRKRVTIPESWEGKRIWLKVGGVRTWGWIWVDDRPVAHVVEGYRALKWEVSDIVHPGKSCEIKIQADNSYPYRNSQTVSYHRWGGITRDIELEATGSAFIDDAWVRGCFDTRCAEVHVAVAGLSGSEGLRLKVEVEGSEVSIPAKSGDNVVIVPIVNFRAWSPERPNLYTARVDLVSGRGIVGTRKERFGVRKLEVRGKEFFLNGKPFFFRGFGDDHTYPITGMSPASKDEHLRHLKKARAAGFNFVRTHTHCEVPEYFDAADEAGVFVQPELSYNCDESSVETFGFDPLRDAEAIWQGRRRHPSFAVYSGGNEGTLGPAAAAAFYRWVKTHDPDRLVIEQDGGTYFRNHGEGTSDYASGPMSMWERGSFNKRAFICHEYMNLAVKGDARLEKDYTGVWEPRMTRAMRRKNLAPFGLSDAWGDLLQDAQHDLQRFWALRGIEHARKDPFCDGFIFWTIVDYTHFDKKANAPNCQGLFDPFWRTKPHGASPEDVATVNSPVAILLDTENRARIYKEDTDPLLFCGCLARSVIDETNRVFSVGETIPAEFFLSQYGEDSIRDARLVWELVADGSTLASAQTVIGDCPVGPARSVGKARIAVPEVAKPVKARLTAKILEAGKARASNGWDFWLFPSVPVPEIPSGIVVAPHGSPAAAVARAAGKSLLLTGKVGGYRDVMLGWWALDWRPKGEQNGLAAKRHEILGTLPYEPFLSPLLFRMLGGGTKLPVAGFSEKDFVMVGENNVDFTLYLAAKERPDGGREVFVSGVDVFAGFPESRTLLTGIIRYLNKDR